jgi:peptide/nickel transport system ATP-binding protein
MYLGRMVELGPTPQVIGQPEHPYTRALLSAIPEADPRRTRRKDLSALRSVEVPSLLNLPPGCTFHPRCPLFEQGLCDVVVPELTSISVGHAVSCHVAVRAYGKDVADGQRAPAGAAR